MGFAYFESCLFLLNQFVTVSCNLAPKNFNMSLVDRLDELDSGAHQGKLDVDELIRALQNERFSPQILPYKGDIVDRLKEQIDDAVSVAQQ
jgi:hypothetical protein